MKTTIYALSLIGLFLTASCTKDRRQDADRSVNDLRLYVDSVKTAEPDYEDEGYWNRVETGYEQRRHATEEFNTQMDEKMKADYEKLKSDYDEMKTSYLNERERYTMLNDHRTQLRNSLYGEGVIGKDLNFGFMTAQNAESVYRHFVETVKANKDAYSREDWDEVKVLYEAMDSRKNEIEKDLAAKDNLKIAKHKVEFSAIKSVNRPLSKMQENHDAKERGGK
jgi:hypothetical protein